MVLLLLVVCILRLVHDVPRLTHAYFLNARASMGAMHILL